MFQKHANAILRMAVPPFPMMAEYIADLLAYAEFQSMRWRRWDSESDSSALWDV